MSIAVIGLQWGDEGKGKVTDFLSHDVDVIVRYVGGANAGHTVVRGDQKAIFHLLPSSVLNSGKVFVLGSRMMIDPETLVDEIRFLKSNLGVELTPDNLKISSRAHVVLHHHRDRDLERERKRNKPIGTTGRGIGPANEDKAVRCGLRMGDLVRNGDIRVSDRIVDFLRPYVIDTVRYLSYLCLGEIILYEGAQGIMLDVDYGTYPYVTSCSVLPPHVEKTIGVFGAYCTRVGEGPFPTEMSDKEQVIKFRERTGEFGATTGRPRRIGWLDLPTLKYAISVSNTNRLVMTKLDNLSGMDKINLCVRHSNTSGFAGDSLETSKPIYEELDGWEPFENPKHFKDLPDNAQKYIERIQQYLGMFIQGISVGPRSDQLIFSETNAYGTI